MSPRPAPSRPDFGAFAADMAEKALHELGPAAPGAEPAALGFALGLARSWAGPAGLIWVGEEAAFAEDGAPYPPGLAQFGWRPRDMMVVRARKREEALWAAEQALSAPGAVVLCMLGAGGKALDLKATRRLLLFGERNASRCLLLRRDGETSAAWTRWRIAPAESDGVGRELGAPAFRADLIRNRAGPAGLSFTLDWNAHACAFAERAVAGDLSAAPVDRSADPVRARA